MAVKKITAKLPTPYLRQPERKKENHNAVGKGVFKNLAFSLSAMQGWRVTMEDAHLHELPSRSNPKLALFGIFDGHAGDQAAKYAAANVATFIQNSESFQYLDKNNMDPAIIARSAMEGFIDCDESLKKVPDFMNGKDFSGCTGVMCLITVDCIIVANTGDSRLVFVRGDRPVFGTHDHKPSDEREKHRVVQAGGRILYDRINGDLASARSFGDFRYKKNPELPASLQQVTVLPDVTILDREPTDQMIIIACDGVWDVMSNLECSQFVLCALRLGCSLQQAADAVLEECLRKSSGDNMSIMIIALEDIPKETGSQVTQRISLDQIRNSMYYAVL